jgi:ABC-type phosphate transport system substrate-binding protein
MNAARKVWGRLTAVALALLTALYAGIIAPAQPASAATFTPINGAGSTWAFPALNQWINFVKQNQLVLSYTADGSVAGLNDFANGLADWAASEIPFGVQDGGMFIPPPARGYSYLPDLAGGLAFMYNLSIGGQRVTSLRLSGAVIAGIFTNQITRWNDPEIAADNPGLTLPATPITPVVRSDADGGTAVFTQWMAATQSSAWTAYCQAVGRSPCTQTYTYPVQPGTAMIGVPQDAGVAGFVSQAGANGAIGFTEDSYALETGFPVAKVLNAAGYYTAPTPANVGVSLLDARLNPDQTADLSPVYSDTDPRTYELSYYSYLVIPTDLTHNMTADKGYTLAAFGQFLLCQGQQQVNALGYAALPINLVEAGFTQLQQVPGASLPATTAAFIASCGNPTFAPDGTNTLAGHAPPPAACDQQGATQCAGGVIALTASPNPPAAGQVVTLTATVGTGGPAGWVQFEIGGTAIGPPVLVDSNGVATTTTTFAVPGTDTVSAVFTPAGASTFSTPVATLSLTVLPTPVGTLPMAVTVPVTGTFTLTVDTADTVTLVVSESSATAATTPIVVSDTRNTYPGWSVSGQVSDFTNTAAGSLIPGNQLGWVPTGSSLGAGVTLGAVVAPGAPGLGTTAATLASAHAGSGGVFGTSTLGANLTLAIPPLAAAGSYTSSLNVSAVTALP